MSHNSVNLSSKKIFFVVILNFIITISEIIGGFLSKSLSLLSDSLHNFSDTIAIVLTYIAYKIGKKPANIQKTFGYKRAEIIIAFLNSSLLVIISIFIIIEAFKRFRTPLLINSNLMLLIAIIGLLGNFISIILLKKDSSHNLNIRSSFLHLMGDTVSSVVVIIGSLLIKFFNLYFIDSIFTILIAVYIIKEAIEIILKTTNILMQAAPDLKFDEIKTKIERIDGVKNIHHIHCWLINEDTIHFEAHLDTEDMKISEIEKIYSKIEEILLKNYGIQHITIQPEVNKCFDKNLIKGG